LQEHLFDLSNDVEEKNDLRERLPDDFQRLKRLYSRWEEEVRKDRRGRPG
jgi:hypothetical protein